MDDFDLDRYLRASKKVDLTGLRWDRIRDVPLSVGEARTLAYMMDIETHTVIFLRDLLATRAAFEPDVTAFLSCWVYEELWHGEAFSRFLGEAGYRLGPQREQVLVDSPYPTRMARNVWIRRKLGSKGYLSHVATLAAGAVVKDFVALHMTWGALNELTTLTAYHRLIAKTEHPVLVELLDRIIKDERRHFAFYRSQARMRLGRSRRRAGRPHGRWIRPSASCRDSPGCTCAAERFEKLPVALALWPSRRAWPPRWPPSGPEVSAPAPLEGATWAVRRASSMERRSIRWHPRTVPGGPRSASALGRRQRPRGGR
jgi:rubrerythrin